jgi:hypothetical protein
MGPSEIAERVMRKIAVIDTGALRALVEPTVFDKVERAVSPKSDREEHDSAAVGRGVRREAYRLKKLLGIQPNLVGSMHNRTNLPGDVDIDFFVPTPDKAGYDKALQALRGAQDIEASSYNKSDAGYSVFTRKTPGTSGFPIDIALAHGPDADRYVKASRRYKRDITGLPADLRQQLLDKKQQLQDTPFFSKWRYRRFKRELRELADIPTLTRTAEKQATILNIGNSSVRAAFDKFLRRKDLVGHRTTAGKEVIQQGSVLSSTELNRRGLLKNVETGRVGERKDAKKDDKLQKHLKDAVFATRGGLLDEDSYGDTGILAINKNTQYSPHLNLLTNEVIIPKRDSGKARPLSIGKGYVLAPRKKIKQYDKERPEFRYIATEDLDTGLKDAIYLPAKSYGEVLRRWIPALRDGTIRLPA